MIQIEKQKMIFGGGCGNRIAYRRLSSLYGVLSHNCLPLRMNIARRGMEIDTRCPVYVCARLDEDGAHCFLKCKHVKKCWHSLNLERERLQLINLHSAREVIEVILQMNREKRRLIICLLWSWWMNRNKVNAGEGLL